MNRLLQLTDTPQEGTPFSKNLSDYKGVFLGGQSRTSFDGLSNPVHWLFEYNPITGVLTVEREDGSIGKEEVFTGKKGLESVSVVFDRQMQIVVTYVQHDVCYIWYYDSLEDTYKELALPGRYVRATLTTHYTLHAPFSEVVIGYVRDEKLLCIRLQRDRYSKEYIVKEFENRIKLISLSYTDKNRFQYEVMEAM